MGCIHYTQSLKHPTIQSINYQLFHFANNGFSTVMEIAVLLAAGLRQWIDLGVIIGILLLNAVVGWYQEKQAADVVASLKGDIAMRSTVVRDGQEQEIKARELVPGDIVSSSTHPTQVAGPTSHQWLVSCITSNHLANCTSLSADHCRRRSSRPC